MLLTEMAVQQSKKCHEFNSPRVFRECQTYFDTRSEASRIWKAVTQIQLIARMDEDEERIMSNRYKDVLMCVVSHV